MSHSSGIRRIDFVALILIALAFAALGLPAADDAREAARRIQCSNNLKQLGLGTHNFHDTFGGIPPLGIGAERASYFVMLFPFVEQSNVYNSLNGGNRGEKKTVFSQPIPENWALLSDAEKKAAASIKIMHCPARRAANPVQMTSSADPAFQGPVSDYCVVFIDCDLDFDRDKPEVNGAPVKDAPPIADWKKHVSSTSEADVERQKGAIRLANVGPEPADYKKWKPRDTFARITDGMANTVIVGEKHLRASEVRKYSADMKQQDGVFLFEGPGGREFGVTRNIRLPVGKGHLAFDNDGDGPDDDFGFGSQHPGGIHFLVGDGSTRMLAFDTDRNVMNKIGHAQDGLTTMELDR